MSLASNKSFIATVALVIAVEFSARSYAQIPPEPLKPLTMTSESGRRSFVSEHIGTFNGKHVKYRAEVAETIVKADPETAGASLLSFSYLADAGSAPNRPVMFIFNGGPGGASSFLHLGALGPRLTKPSGKDGAEDVFVDNPLSPLDTSDLVFVDPTDTGFSHTLAGTPTKPFYSVDGDSEATCLLVIHWLKIHNRLESPVYIYGESYGTMRAVAMARDLARGTPKIVVAGLLLGGNSLGY